MVDARETADEVFGGQPKTAHGCMCFPWQWHRFGHAPLERSHSSGFLLIWLVDKPPFRQRRPALIGKRSDKRGQRRMMQPFLRYGEMVSSLKKSPLCHARIPTRPATTRLPGHPDIHLHAKFAEGKTQPLGHAGDGFGHWIIFLFLDGSQRRPRHMRELVKLVERQPALFAHFAENGRQRQNRQRHMVAIHARFVFNFRLLIIHASSALSSRRRNRAADLKHGSLNRETWQNPKSFKKVKIFLAGTLRTPRRRRVNEAKPHR
jgi:hypothetical protein